ncbi:MAG: glycoside hydrolase family 127 protein [Clostridia bacterium]|nr:glycoside hydrolase family 127 protein [Clostridia bacterium]
MKAGLKPIPFYKTEITDGFWKERQRINREVTLYAVRDRFKETGRFDAFRCDWKEGDPNKPHFFWDSDIAKWIEGVANVCRRHPDPELIRECDEVIDLIVKNQGEDGYFNIYFTVIAPERRFLDRDKHELYCAGHLFEAAVAYYEATGKRKLLDAMCRYADYIEKRFKTDRDTGFKTSGHEEIELALFRLYECTGEQRYFDLAEFFINERGPDDVPLSPTSALAYNQSHLPVRRQREAVGHAVRATYLYSAMADLCAYTEDPELFEACDELFDSITKRRMYVTGGIGSSASGEALTRDYDLPNILSYSESCAGMGLIFFALRMLSLNPDSKYADVIERVMYNNLLSSTSIDGKSFFYTNPLETIPYLYYKDNITEYYKIKYPKPTRSQVFKTSCCPSNIVRVISSMENLIWGEDGERLYIHQFISAETTVTRDGRDVRVTMRTDYPKSGRVEISVSGAPLKLAVRIPYFVKGNYGKTQHGYALLTLQDGESTVFEFDMTPRIVEARDEVLFAACKCCVMRGPVVYCSEAIDNGEGIRNTLLDLTTKIEEDYTGNYHSPVLRAEGWRRSTPNDAPLYSDGVSPLRKVELTLIPYYAFANRGESEMSVWLRYKM